MTLQENIFLLIFYFWLITVLYSVLHLVYGKKKSNIKNNQHNTYKKSRNHKVLNKNKRKYTPKYYETNNGEIVKSYGEKAIADYLQKRGIKYEYEHVYVRKDGGINKPDFYLPKYDIYIEYFGMMKYSNKYRFEMHLKFDTFDEENMKVIKIYKKHITNHTLDYGIKINFKNLTGENLPNRPLQMSI